MIWCAILAVALYIFWEFYSRHYWGMGIYQRIRGGLYGYRAWHFLPGDGKLRYEDAREVKAGETLKVRVTPSLCNRGLHASVNFFKALHYAPDFLLTRVIVKDHVVLGNDKLAGRSRTCVALYPGLYPLFMEWVYEVALSSCKNKPILLEGMGHIRKMMDEPDPRKRAEAHAIFKNFYYSTRAAEETYLMLLMSYALNSKYEFTELAQEAIEVSSWWRKRALLKALRKAGVKDL